MKSFDVDFARSHFPAIDKLIFLDNAGGTMVPTQVINRMTRYMSENQVQPGAPYPQASEAAEQMREGERSMAMFLNADEDEVMVGASTTSNIYMLSHALRPLMQQGDEVIVTNLDHEANSGAWRRLAEFGIVIKEWQLNPENYELEIDTLKSLLTDRTRLVCFTACSNITGSINDVQEITRVIHDAGAMVCVDAVAYAPHRCIDVKAWNADFLVCSPYKFFGPHVGLLYGKREHLENAAPQNHFFIEDAPLKIHAGYPVHEHCAALAGVQEYMDELYDRHFVDDPAKTDNAAHNRFECVYDIAADHEQRLTQRFLEFINSREDIRLIGRNEFDKDRRVPTFSLVLQNKQPNELVHPFGKKGIGVSGGHFYAKRCIDALGLGNEGVLRISMAHYNTVDEIDRLINTVEPLLET